MIGAFAVAISLFVVTHRQYELYEATHENFFTFVVDVLPYLWLITFGVMVYAAIYNLRHTKRGYRYPVSIIILSSVLLSFAGGSALQMFGFGYSIDNLLGQNMTMYMSQAKLERKLWQRPEEGRLLGRQVLTTEDPNTTVIFEDIGGQRWNLNVSDLSTRDIELLSSSDQVRLLGKAVNPKLYMFHACGAFPWMIESGVTIKDMSRERDEFVERIYSHMRTAEKQLKLLEGATFATSSIQTESVCATIAAVRRMPNKVQH